MHFLSKIEKERGAAHVPNKGLASRIYKEFSKVDHRKPNNPIKKKKEQKILMDISRKRIHRWQKRTWKDVRYRFPLGKCKFSHKELSLNTCQIGPNQMLVRIWKVLRPRICCWECKMSQPSWKDSLAVS